MKYNFKMNDFNYSSKEEGEERKRQSFKFDSELGEEERKNTESLD